MSFFDKLHSGIVTVWPLFNGVNGDDQVISGNSNRVWNGEVWLHAPRSFLFGSRTKFSVVDIELFYAKPHNSV